MARRKRLQTPGLIRHVMARGNGRMSIFLDDTDYRRFVQLLADVVERFEVECWNYCVMPNHYHATLCPSRPNISEAMRQLNSGYAQYWNRRHDRVGHVFQGRFKAQIVQKEDYLVALCRYVAMNPVRAGLTTRPEDWKWSSYPATIALVHPPPFLAVPSVLRLFGEAEEQVLQARFAGHVLSLDGYEQMEDRIRSPEQILGDRAFKEAVCAETQPPPDPPQSMVGAPGLKARVDNRRGARSARLRPV